MGEEADADWQAGLIEWGYNDAEEYYKMVVVNKRAPSLGGFSQERLAKDDIRLLIEAVEYAYDGRFPVVATAARLELLIEKLKRMLK